MEAGHRARPTALVLDFFMDGQIHDVQPDEDPALRGPGGRRKQQRRVDACDEKLGVSKNGWFLDGLIRLISEKYWKILKNQFNHQKIWWLKIIIP